jgi:hypothetical protein
MRDGTTGQSVIFKDLFGKPVVACFDQPNASSDGGAVLLKACDERLGLTHALAECSHDPRQQSKVAHSFHGLLRQRVYGIACGYEDCNDAARIGEDPVNKMLLDRDPIKGSALADTVVARHRKRLRGRARRITVELETTDDPTHGASS